MREVDDLFACHGGCERQHSVTDALFSTLYCELHRLAKRELARRWSPLSLSVTTLLHEAYLGMAGREGLSFPDHARFIGYAARVMRGLIIDHARNRNAAKRGGEFDLTSLESEIVENRVETRHLSVISDILDELAKAEPGLAEVVDLKFFCGFSFAEISAIRSCRNAPSRGDGRKRAFTSVAAFARIFRLWGMHVRPEF